MVLLLSTFWPFWRHVRIGPLLVGQRVESCTAAKLSVKSQSHLLSLEKTEVESKTQKIEQLLLQKLQNFPNYS